MFRKFTSERVRRARRRRLVILTVIRTLFAVALFLVMWQASYVPWMRVDSVAVSGIKALPREKMVERVGEEVSGAYAGIFSKRNIFLVPKRTIESALVREFPRIREVRLAADGMRGLSLSVVEREPEAILCRAKKTECFFMDGDGFVFAEAPQLAGTSFVRYEAALADVPLGKYFMSSRGGFSELHQFVQSLGSLALFPKVVSLTGNSYVITARVLTRDIRLVVGGTVSYEQSYRNLEAILQDPKFSLDSVASIDLRFGNKVFFREEGSGL